MTGAAGFSGPPMIRALLDRGHTIQACAGRRSVGRLPDALVNDPRVDVHMGDLADPGFPLPAAVDAIIHMAATSPAPGVSATAMVSDNVAGSLRLIRHAVDHGVGTVIQFSSLSVHGTIHDDQVTPDTPIINPDLYGQTKRIAEELLIAQHDRMRGFMIRLPGVIGPGSGRNWLSRLLAQARQGAAVSMVNPDAPFNNAIHVDDLAAFAADLLMDQSWHGMVIAPVGTDTPIAIRAVVGMIVAATGNHSPIQIKTDGKAPFVISNHMAQRFHYRPSKTEDAIARFVTENLNNEPCGPAIPPERKMEQ